MATKNKKSEKELLEEISTKLDKLMGILAIQGKKEDEQIQILKKLGFPAVEIEKLLGVKGRLRDKKGWKKS